MVETEFNNMVETEFNKYFFQDCSIEVIRNKKKKYLPKIQKIVFYIIKKLFPVYASILEFTYISYLKYAFCCFIEAL